MGPHRTTAATHKVGRDAQLSNLDDAFAVLVLHVAGPDGRCVGCRDEWSELAGAPCQAVRRALSVVETHGVVDWDRVAESADGPECARCLGVGRVWVASRRTAALSGDASVWRSARCVDCGGCGWVRGGLGLVDAA